MKNTMIRSGLAVAVVMSMIGASSRAEAGFVNDTIHGFYLFPSTTSVNQDLGIATVNPTAFFNNVGINAVTVFNTDMVLSTLVPTDTKTTAVFNGFGLLDTTGTFGITSFTVDPLTNVAGFVASDVTITSNEVFINIEGLTLTSSQIIQIDFTFAPSAVPEPSSLVMCGIAGAIGLVVSRRRKRVA
jgi:hypothetical protein